MPMSICPSNYILLNHWAEFNQTCYITVPCGKGECDSNISMERRDFAMACHRLRDQIVVSAMKMKRVNIVSFALPS